MMALPLIALVTFSIPSNVHHIEDVRINFKATDVAALPILAGSKVKNLRLFLSSDINTCNPQTLAENINMSQIESIQLDDWINNTDIIPAILSELVNQNNMKLREIYFFNLQEFESGMLGDIIKKTEPLRSTAKFKVYFRDYNKKYLIDSQKDNDSNGMNIIDHNMGEAASNADEMTYNIDETDFNFSFEEFEDSFF